MKNVSKVLLDLGTCYFLGRKNQQQQAIAVLHLFCSWLPVGGGLKGKPTRDERWPGLHTALQDTQIKKKGGLRNKVKQVRELVFYIFFFYYYSAKISPAPPRRAKRQPWEAEL